MLRSPFPGHSSIVGAIPISVNFRQVARWPRPKVDREGQPYYTTVRLGKPVYSRVDPRGQPICIKLRTSPSNAVDTVFNVKGWGPGFRENLESDPGWMRLMEGKKSA